MRTISVRNASRNTELGRRVRLATSLAERMVGLLNTPVLSAGDGMYLSPCTSVHTFFMRYTIDVLFIDKDGLVLMQTSLKPWRVSKWIPRSQGVLELAEGTLSTSGTRVGDRIEMKDVN